MTKRGNILLSAFLQVFAMERRRGVPVRPASDEGELPGLMLEKKIDKDLTFEIQK